MAQFTEECTVFHSGENRLVGIATCPENCGETGVLIMVGGPQYRVGSHRLFTLLARTLAESGIASFRFDFTGMGDSEGDQLEFHEVLADSTAAIDRFRKINPEVSRIVLWGLCDGASAAALIGYQLPAVSGLVMLNPWVHSGDYSPEVKLSHYYGPLLKGGDTWRRFLTGKTPVVPAIRGFLGATGVLVKNKLVGGFGIRSHHPFVKGMLDGLKAFDQRVLVFLSEQDLTAKEFQGLVENDKAWAKVLASPKITIREIADADHTFSRKAWQDEITELTAQWIRTSSGEGVPGHR